MSNYDGTAIAARRYRILSVVAEGGYGRVYLARLLGSDGFTKDVAIKLLRPGTPDDVVARFRDEVRTLGLIRDRAVVSVEPLTWLDNRPALVMEYADGRSASRLLQEIGAFPPKASLEVIEEVARALDVVYHQPGPEGLPLHLLHRDLKPGNLQIAPSGAVRIVDFGIAVGQFSRELDSGGMVVGTAAYISPERFEGIEGPEADIYSLGVVLRTLVTGESPDANGRVPAQNHPEHLPPDLIAVLRIADLMADPNPAHRPGARRVEELCRELRATLTGMSLRQWAMHNVFPSAGATEDPLVGQILTESDGDLRARPKTAGLLMVAASVAVLVAATFGLGAWLSGPADDIPVLAAVTGASDEVVSFTSSPPGAMLTIDGVPSGTTPVETKLGGGVHTVRMSHHGMDIEREILVNAHAPRRYEWDGGASWRPLY